jgi:glutamate-1-semialdehyde 2,1-aminomutase
VTNRVGLGMEGGLGSRRSDALFLRAKKVMVGGVNSPVRAFNAVGGSPLFLARGKGSKVFDADGNSFIDYVCSWGPLIAGHAHPDVVQAVSAQLRKGSSFGAPTEAEVDLAEKVCSSVPSVERVRFVSSGTEATMSALRLARALTKRNKVLKFDGCYHGHADSFLTQAGSGLATFDLPASAGVTPATAADTLSVPFNDEAALEAAFRSHADEIAAVMVEPVAGNMGVVLPERGFLEKARRLTKADGALLVFDEVITGFRLSIGGAQRSMGIEPDITCLGKILGGGFPVGAYGARAPLMRMVSPEGPVYQAGTLSGNPVAMAAGLTTLSLLTRGSYRSLEEASSLLEEGLVDSAGKAGIDLTVNRAGSMVGVFFAKGPVKDFRAARKTDRGRYAKFHRSMLERGVYLPPSPLETLFVSTAHGPEDVERTITAAAASFKELSGQ